MAPSWIWASRAPFSPFWTHSLPTGLWGRQVKAWPGPPSWFPPPGCLPLGVGCFLISFPWRWGPPRSSSIGGAAGSGRKGPSHWPAHSGPHSVVLLWALSGDLRVWPMGPSQAPPPTLPSNPLPPLPHTRNWFCPDNRVSCLHSSCFSIMNVSMARPLAAVGSVRRSAG